MLRNQQQRAKINLAKQRVETAIRNMRKFYGRPIYGRSLAQERALSKETLSSFNALVQRLLAKEEPEEVQRARK